MGILKNTKKVEVAQPISSWQPGYFWFWKKQQLTCKGNAPVTKALKNGPLTHSWWSSSRFCKKISGFTKSNGDKLILWPCFGGNCLISSSFVKRYKTGGALWKRDSPQSTRVGAPLGQEGPAVAHPSPCWFLAQKVNTLTLRQTYCFKLNSLSFSAHKICRIWTVRANEGLVLQNTIALSKFAELSQLSPPENQAWGVRLEICSWRIRVKLRKKGIFPFWVQNENWV